MNTQSFHYDHNPLDPAIISLEISRA